MTPTTYGFIFDPVERFLLERMQHTTRCYVAVQERADALQRLASRGYCTISPDPKGWVIGTITAAGLVAKADAKKPDPGYTPTSPPPKATA